MTATIIPFRASEPPGANDGPVENNPTDFERDPVRFNAFMAAYEAELQVIAAEMRND